MSLSYWKPQPRSHGNNGRYASIFVGRCRSFLQNIAINQTVGYTPRVFATTVVLPTQEFRAYCGKVAQ